MSCCISNGSTSSQWFILYGINQFHADFFAVTKMFLKNFRSIRSAHDNSTNACFFSQRDLMFSAGIASNWKHGFWC